jgi:hypothetical protein
MSNPFRRPWMSCHLYCRMGIVTAAFILLFLWVPGSSSALQPFPVKIRDIKMGQSMPSVIDMIKGSGTYEVAPPEERKRPSLTWLLPNSPYYRQLIFRFTEKDRLWLIRFDLKKLSRRDLRAIKKSLFEKYGISWNAPLRHKIKDKDIFNYGPPQMGRVYFFDITNRKTGEKAFELMDRITSSEDRPLRRKKKKEDKSSETALKKKDTAGKKGKETGNKGEGSKTSAGSGKTVPQATAPPVESKQPAKEPPGGSTEPEKK